MLPPNISIDARTGVHIVSHKCIHTLSDDGGRGEAEDASKIQVSYPISSA